MKQNNLLDVAFVIIYSLWSVHERPMQCLFKFMLVILDLIRFDLMPGGGNCAVFYKSSLFF